MQAPKIPSFFKSQKAKSFVFNPRYYDERKERKKNIENNKISSIKFSSKRHIQKNQKGRVLKIFLLIIVLSLLAYKLLLK